jgi:hypothetical protein
MLRMKTVITTIALLATALFSMNSPADHSWGKYKWKPSSVPFNLNLGDNVDSDWDGHLLLASTDWSVSTVLDTTVISGSTNPASCNPEAGNIQVCNAEYGDNGWLGIAQIYGRGTTITAGVAKLNDTYYKRAYYNTPAWRQLVMCQEIAHAFGLDHQDEKFGNVNLGTCMDYTDDPDGSIDNEPSNEHPNQHDYDQLETIYGSGKTSDDGSGGDGGGSCNPKSPKCNPATAAGGHAEWGQLVSARGGKEVYVRDMGNGLKIITHVTWTIEHASEHEHY